MAPDALLLGGVLGGIAGVIVVLGIELLEYLRIDDPIGAVPVHGMCGIWGTLSLGLFACGKYGATGPFAADNSAPLAGLFYGVGTTVLVAQLIGNILISLLTAWVIGVLYLAEFRLHRFVDPQFHSALSRVYKFTVVYASFAFIISLVREVVKDMEDMEGDARYDCRTIPLVWGLNAAKFFCVCWLTILVAALIFIQFYVLQFRWWLTIVYTCLGVIYPILQVIKKLSVADQPEQFHKLSQIVKAIMLMGILSMIFLKWYTSWIG